MKITINIDERTGTAIREFCKANGVKQNDYLIGIIEKQFNIDRFGDINELIAKKEKPKQVQMKLIVEKDESDMPKEQSVEAQKEATAIEPKRTKRTIKVK